jgi:hypothetical protein
MSYFYCDISNSSFIWVYAYKCYYSKTQETQDYRSSLWTILPPWIIKPKDNSLFMNVLCQLFYSNLIYTGWRHDTSIIMISRHPQVLLKLPDLNRLWYQKRGSRDQTKNLTTSVDLINFHMHSLIIGQEQLTHSQISRTKKPKSKLAPCHS